MNNTPENVECRTCGGTGVITAKRVIGRKLFVREERCPFCPAPPENVEEPTCH